MTDDESTSARVAADRARAIALALWLTLGATSILVAVHGERSAVSSWATALFLVTPLAIALPGMLRRNRRTFAWATLCLTPHFVYALTEIVANPAIRLYAATMLVLSLALVVALIAYLRTTRRSDDRG